MDSLLPFAAIALCAAMLWHRERIVRFVREFKARLKEVDDLLHR